MTLVLDGGVPCSVGVCRALWRMQLGRMQSDGKTARPDLGKNLELPIGSVGRC